MLFNQLFLGPLDFSPFTGREYCYTINLVYPYAYSSAVYASWAELARLAKLLQTNVVPQRDSQSRCQSPRVFWSAQTRGALELSTISFPEPTCLLLFKFDTVLPKPNFDFLGFTSTYCMPLCKPRHACAVEPELLKSWALEIDYSRAPCLGADQKTRRLGERDFKRVGGESGEVFYFQPCCWNLWLLQQAKRIQNVLITVFSLIKSQKCRLLTNDALSNQILPASYITKYHKMHAYRSEEFVCWTEKSDTIRVSLHSNLLLVRWVHYVLRKFENKFSVMHWNVIMCFDLCKCTRDPNCIGGKPPL